MKTLLLVCFSLFAICGCLTPEEVTKRRIESERVEAEHKAEVEKAEAECRNKIEMLKKMRILNVRERDTAVDLVLEDGTIVTIYSYQTGGGQSGYYHHVGVK